MKTMKYEPHPMPTDDVEVPADIILLSEQIAENVHDVWAASRIAEGWTWGPERNDIMKQHPCLVPYTELPDAEKEYDRKTAMQTLKLILKLGYTIKKK